MVFKIFLRCLAAHRTEESLSPLVIKYSVTVFLEALVGCCSPKFSGTYFVDSNINVNLPACIKLSVSTVKHTFKFLTERLTWRGKDTKVT